MTSRGLLGLLGILLVAAFIGAGIWSWFAEGDEDAGLGLQDDPLSESASEEEGPQLSADGSPVAPRTRGKTGQRKDTATSDGAQGTPLSLPEAAPGSIVGAVCDADGQPIQGATVSILEPGKKTGRHGVWEMSSSTTTDENGQFLHDAPLEGFYLVRVVADGYMSMGVNGTGGGAPLGIRLTEAMKLAGVLREKTSGAAIAGLDIWAIAVKSGQSGQRYPTHTDEEGRFSLELPRGEPHFIQFPASTYVMWGQSGDWIHARWGPFEADDEDLSLALERGLVLGGVVTDASGAEIQEQFRVEVLGRTPNGDIDYSRRRFAQTSDEGAFELRGLPAGQYLVTITPLLNTDKPSSGLTRSSVDGVAAGTTDLVIELTRGETMRGRIVDEDGEPVTGKGYVHIYPQGSTASSPDSIHAKLDGKGGFETTPLDPGTTYDLLANAFDGFHLANVDGVRTGDAVVQVTLERAGTIKGRIVRADGGAVPAGCGVMAMALDAPRGAKGIYGYTSAAAGGSFTLNGLGPYHFRIASGGAGSGFVAAGSTVGIQPGAADVVVKIKRGVALSGKLVDAHGDPVKTHMLTAASLDNPRTPAAWTAIKDDDGSFHFAGVAPGRLRILARIGKKSVVVGVVTAPAKDVELKLPEDPE